MGSNDVCQYCCRGMLLKNEEQVITSVQRAHQRETAATTCDNHFVVGSNELCQCSRNGMVLMMKHERVIMLLWVAMSCDNVLVTKCC